MRRSDQIEKKVAEALDSLEGMHRAEPAPWFYTRVNARLQKEAGSIWVSAGRLLSRPGIAIAGVMIILTMNVVLLVRGTSTGSARAEQAVLESESMIASSSSFDYENLGQ